MRGMAMSDIMCAADWTSDNTFKTEGVMDACVPGSQGTAGPETWCFAH